MARSHDIVPYSEEALARAQEEMRSFEAARQGRDRLARLRESHPRHPVLLGMSVASLAAGSMFLLGLGALLAPWVSNDAADWLLDNPAMQIFPPGLIVLALCAATLYGVLWALAVQLGGDAPLLRADLRELNRLRSEVQRLTVAKDVHKRLTNTPAPPRRRYS